MTQQHHRTTRLALVATAVGLVTAALIAPVAAQDLASVEIKTTKVAGNVYMLEGRGGNIGVSVGDDGVFMIDDQFAPLTDKITAAVKKLSDQPIRFVVNTHWHGDHTGGNENLGEAGAIIVAHENVRSRMSKDQFIEAFNSEEPAAPEVALPVITFTDAVTFHWNGDAVDILHVDPAHTDGDAIVHFHGANVVHMGDTYFNGMYPFIDVGSGGSIDGMIAAVSRALGIVKADTRIIPGHGPLSGVEELREYRAMLIKAQKSVHALVAAGKTREETIAAKPTKNLDAKWGGGFMKPDVWTGIVYDGMRDGTRDTAD